MQSRTPVGWYPDQHRPGRLRWWDGAAWTSWVSDGGRTWDERPTPLGAEHLDGLRFVREVFLPEARRRGAVHGPWGDGLDRLTDDLTEEARRAAGHVATEAPAARTAAAAFAVPTRSVPTPSPSRAVGPTTHRADGSTAGHPTAPPAEPGPVARWWADLRSRLDVDLTMQGLAYLGVLLLFVGVFGLVAFAFGDVAPSMRPVAELAVAVVPFIAARQLARSGATFVARAMVALGGLLLALMLITSMVDGAPIPPDLHGAALPLGAGLGCAGLAALYIALARRRPGTALVAVVAPVLWLAAALGAVGLARPVPSGEGVAVPGAAQTAVLALAVLATTLLGRAWTARSTASPAVGPTGLRARLADGALAAAQPGAVVVAVLAVVAGMVEGWPVLPFAVTVLALAVVVRVADRVSSVTGDHLLVIAWIVLVLRLLATDVGTPLLSASHGTVVGPAGLPVLLPAALVLGVLLAELLLRGAPGTGRVLLVWALPVVALLSLPDGWWAMAAIALLAVWSTWRRVNPEHVRGLGGALDLTAAGAPVLLLISAGGTLDAPSTLLIAAGLVVGSTPLARGWLRRPGAPHVWAWWWGSAGVVTLLASVAGALDGWLLDDDAWTRSVIPVTVVVVLLALVAGPLSRARTVAVATPVVWWAWLAIAVATELDVVVRPGGLGLLGLAAVLIAHRIGSRAERSRRRAYGVLGLAGHATGLVAVIAALDPTSAGAEPHVFGRPALVVALTLVAVIGTLGWLVSALASDRQGPARSGSPLVELTDQLGGVGRYGPWALALAGLVTSASLALDMIGALPFDHPWWFAVLAGAGLVLAALTRVLRTSRALPLLPWFAYGLVLLGVLTSSGGWPTVVAFTAVIAQPLLVQPVPVRAPGTLAQAVGPARRHPLPVWTGWVAVTPFALLLTWEVFAGTLMRDVLVAGGLVVVGGLLAVGAYVADRARAGDARVLPRRAAALPPAVLGVAQVVLGILVAVASLDTWRAGVVLAGAAVVVGVLSALTGIGTVAAVGVLIAWVAASGLFGEGRLGAWAHVGTALVMAAAAQVIARRGPPRVRWTRWDAPLAIGAALPALLAVMVAERDERILVWLVVGAAVVTAAVSLRRRRTLSEVLGWIGTALVLSSTVDAGPWWTVLGLATLSAVHTALAAVRERGVARRVRQWVGALAAAAAWLVVPVAAAWDTQRASDVTAVVAAAAVLATVLGVRSVGRGRSWLGPWGGIGAVLALGACLGQGLTVTTWWHTAAWVLLAAAAAALVGVVRWPWWREVAALTATAGLVTGLGAASLPSATRALVLVAVSCATAVGVVLASRARSRWARAVSVVGVATVVLAWVTVLEAATDDAVAAGNAASDGVMVLAAGVLAATAVQAAALGLARRSLGLRIAAPLLAWGAWALYAVQSLGSSPVWFTVPVGLALVVVVAVWRADRRERDLDPADRGVVALELAAIAFLVVSSFIAGVTVSVLHALVASGIGVLVALWGVATRVRRRLLAGAGVVLAGIALAAVVPLAALLPAAGQVGLWVLVAVLGLVVVVAATFLERGRTTVREGRARLVDATRGWE